MNIWGLKHNEICRERTYPEGPFPAYLRGERVAGRSPSRPAARRSLPGGSGLPSGSGIDRIYQGEAG